MQWWNEPHGKTSKITVLQVKIQISVGIQQVISEFSLHAAPMLFEYRENIPNNNIGHSYQALLNSVNAGREIMHLHAITRSNNQNSANCEVNFRLAIQNYELKKYGFFCEKRKLFNLSILLFCNLDVLSCILAKCYFQAKSCTYLLGENTARRLLKKVLKILTFPPMISPSKCVTVSKYFIYQEKIIFQINA